ncbi:MAG TPA: hypothetical protein VGM41_02900 [Chitinophagaceae bacterium]
MDVTKKKTVILFFLYVLAAQHTCFAQQPSLPTGITKIKFALQGHISLDSLTRYVHRHSSIRFSFNSLKVKGSKVIDFPKGVYTLPDLLAQIRKATTLYYSYYDGYVVFQDNPPKQQHTPNKIHTVPKKPVTKSKPVSERVITTAANDSTGKKVIINDTARQQQPMAPPPVKNEPLPAKQSTSTAVNKKRTAGASQRSSGTAAKPAANDKERLPLSLHYGLLLNVNIPLQGFSNYFTGTNGNSQPYNLLIPGAWLSLTLGNKHELTLAAKPGQQYFTHNTVLTTAHDSAFARDTAMKTTTLIKTSGAVLSILYHYHIGDNWVVGAGIQYNWTGSALISRQKYLISNNQVVYDSITGIKKTDADWQLLQSSFIAGRSELAYQTGSLRVGLAVVFPLTNIAAAPGVNIRTLNEQVFLRWDIGNLFNPQPSTD